MFGAIFCYGDEAHGMSDLIELKSMTEGEKDIS